MAHKNTGLFAETFDFTLLWRCLVYLLLSSQSRMGPKPTADQRVKSVWNYFAIERVEWKQIVSMSEFRKAKQETKRKSESWQIVLLCNKANISVMIAMKQILVLLQKLFISDRSNPQTAMLSEVKLLSHGASQWNGRNCHLVEQAQHCKSIPFTQSSV